MVFIKVKESIRADLSESDKREIIEHLSQNCQKYYGRFTGNLSLAKQKQYWEDLAGNYKEHNVGSGYRLKESVRIWIKRANEKYEQTCGRTGSSSDEQLTEFQLACRQLQRHIKGDDYMDGFEAPQSSGTNKIITSTPIKSRPIANKSQLINKSSKTAVTSR